MGSSDGVRIFYALVAGFLIGVFARSLLPITVSFSLFLVVIAFAVVTASLGSKNRALCGILLAAVLTACALGTMRMNGSLLRGDDLLEDRLGQKIEFAGVVADEPDERDTSVRVPIRATTLASSTKELQAIVLVILPAHTDVYYGERVTVSGVVQRPETFQSGDGRAFDYPGYLAVRGIGYELDRAKLLEGEGFSGNPVVAASYRAKNFFVSGLARALPEPHAGLAGGITVGDKRALGKELTEEFRTVSLVHIIVLSGYNITVVIAGVFWVLAYFRAPKYLRFGLAVFVALFFAVVTGFASASLRASLMALIAISGELSGRIYKPERALALVALAMVFWNPYLLVFDPGFQLSFLATAGLIMFSPLFMHFFSRVPERLGLKDIVVTTSSAQIAVLPLLLYESGTLSLVALPANLLVLCAVPAAMLFSAIAGFGGLIAGPLSPIIGFPSYLLLSYILDAAHLLSSIPFAAISVPAFSAWWLLPVYLLLFGYGFKLQPQKSAAPEDRGPRGETT